MSNDRSLFTCLWACVFIACLSLVSCGKKDISTTTDTTKAAKKIAPTPLPVDSPKVKAANENIKTVFQYIEKECPNLKKDLPALEKKILDKAPIENRIGDIRIKNEDMDLTIKFKGDQPILSGKVYSKIVTNTTTIHHRDTWMQSAWKVWPLWVIPLLILLIILIVIIRRILK